MGDTNWMELLAVQERTTALLKTNSFTQQYGLTLSNEDTQLLVRERQNSLRQERRVEFGEGILPKLIYTFCDSAYINQDNYVDTLVRLQEIFYLYKNEMLDELTDDELIAFMEEQFESICSGDLDYLESTCLDIFAQAVRAGYREYRRTGGIGEYEQFDVVRRWDRELYLEALRELCWE